MKTAVGMMACIAIAFLYITSPQSTTSYASVSSRHQEMQSPDQIAIQILTLEQSIQDATQKLLDAQELSLASQATGMEQLEQKLTRTINDQIESRFVSAESEQACSDEDLRTLIKQMQADLEELKSKQRVEAVSVYPSAGTVTVYKPSSSAVGSGYGSTGSKVSYGSTGSSVASYGRTVTRTVNSSGGYQGRWQNHDGLSARRHAEIMHGINTSGMTDQQVAALRDHDHDTFGPGHPAEMRASRTVSRTVSHSKECPGGVCPVNSGGAYTRGVPWAGGGLLGFGILGRNR